MAYISGFDRNQSFLFSLNDFISDDNPVRLIDLFVDLLDLPALGFISHSPSSPGQRPYRSSDLLKLHLYGYVNGIRSSRKLAAESSRNVELMWLLNNVSPAKSCISDFIRLNKSPIHNVFKKFVDFLKFADFVDAKACVIDGSKIRAQNSRNKFFLLKRLMLLSLSLILKLISISLLFNLLSLLLIPTLMLLFLLISLFLITKINLLNFILLRIP